MRAFGVSPGSNFNFTICWLILGKSLNFSDPRFPQRSMSVGDDDNTVRMVARIQ